KIDLLFSERVANELYIQTEGRTGIDDEPCGRVAPPRSSQAFSLTSSCPATRSSMASRLLAPCITALLLLAVATISSDASFNVLEKYRRKAHLEPADEAGYRTYIVLLEPPVVSQDM
ncbi:unnamed protein product, partial [Urochloa humidicola]